MKSVFVVEDNGQGMEEVRAFLRERGYGVTEYSQEYCEKLRFTQFAVEHASCEAYWITSEGHILYGNDAACRNLGYTHEELVQMTVSDIDPFFPPEVFAEHWRELRQKGSVTLEALHRAKDGRIYPVEVNANYVVFDDKELNCAFVTDISDRKLAEEKLLLQQFCIEKMDTIFLQLSAGGTILSANECACRSLGYTRDELLDLSDADITPVSTYEKKLEQLRILDAQGSVTGETVLRRKDGSTFPAEFSVNKLYFHEKQYIVWFGRDITEHKKAEEALQMSQFIVDKASIGICRGHEDGRILYANEHFARMVGYTREELCSMTYFDIVPDMGGQRWRDHRRLLRSAGSRKFEAVHRRKDGTLFPVEVTVNYLEFGEEPFSCSFTQDITESKKAEEALRESERKFRLLIETSPNAIIVISGERIVYANHAAMRVSGFSREQLMNMEFWNFVHDDFRDVARDRILARLRGEPVSSSFEYRLVGSRGEDKWVVAASVPMDYEGAPAILITFADITEVKRTEEALRESEARLKLAMDMAKLVQWEFDGTTGMFSFDDQFYALYGTSSEREGRTNMSPESYARKFVHPDDIPMVAEFIAQSLENRDKSSTGRIEHRIIRADGEVRHISVSVEVVRDRDGRVVRCRGANQDITERKRAEEKRKSLETQLNQIQKMEAVGQLAGGIAHDFNNILTAIMGFAEVMAMRMEQGNPLEHHVRQILAAAERASDLTRGLLAFSRKQVLHAKAFEVHEIIDGVKNMLRRLIPEDVDFRVKTAATGMIVMADRGQVEQVLMNLVTNARDAMPAGGVLTLESAPGIIDDDFIKRNGFGTPGRYAGIIVRDTGCGMDEETRGKIFEPFFTTKAVGKGTGLGLSITYGIVKQHNGFITVDSSPGQGTKFSVYLPLVEPERHMAGETVLCMPSPGGSETILLVEDDDVVRDLNRTVLEEAGYTLIEASDGREALEIFSERWAEVDILVTDVIMPNMDGKRLYEEVTKIRPEVKVLFMSGYSTDTLDTRGVIEDGNHFMPKPVLPSELLKRLREILDRN